MMRNNIQPQAIPRNLREFQGVVATDGILYKRLTTIARRATSGGTTPTAIAISTGTTTSGMPTTGLLSSANLFGLLRLPLPGEFRFARCVASRRAFCRCLAGAPIVPHIFCYPNLLPPMPLVERILVSPSFRPPSAHMATFAPVLNNSR